MKSMPIAVPAVPRAIRTIALPLLLASAATALAQPADAQGTLSWAPCVDAPWLDCATLEVPVQYGVAGPTVGLAVARAKVLDPTQRIGVLFLHPGAHASGIDFIQAVAGTSLFQSTRERFDIVSLDPRGAVRSRPLHCNLHLLPLPDEDDDATLIAYFNDYSRRIARQCLDEDPEFVRSITGQNFARDIDELRQALGERQLTFYLASNSGPVAGAYASLFPHRVRALLIDAPVGPELRDYWIERRNEQGGSIERTLQRLDQICRRSPSCPLVTFGVVNAFDEISRRLELRPVPLPNGGVFTARDFAFTFFYLLPREYLWLETMSELAEALDGDLSFFIAIHTSADGSGGDNSIVARLCNDYGPRRGAADYLPITEAMGAMHSRFYDRQMMMFDAALCAAWPPADPPVIRNVAHELEVPALTFHAEFDSDAPFAWSFRLGQAMGMERHVVRYTGGGHGVVHLEQPCVRDTVERYWFDLQLPPEGLTCPAEVTPGVQAVAAERVALPSEAPLRLPTPRR